MLNVCVKQWYENKELLKDALENDRDLEDREYKDLVKLVFKYVINPNLPDAESNGLWDYTRITEIDEGNYQGTLLYLIPRETYQPKFDDYLITCVDYGSCTVCDTLKNIRARAGEVSKEKTIKSYLDLCRNIVQQITTPRGSRLENDENYKTRKY